MATLTSSSNITQKEYVPAKDRDIGVKRNTKRAVAKHATYPIPSPRYNRHAPYQLTVTLFNSPKKYI